MPTAPMNNAPPFPNAQAPGRRPAVDPVFVMAAAADLHDAGMLTERVPSFEERAAPTKEAIATGDFDPVGANHTEFTRSPRLDRKPK